MLKQNGPTTNVCKNYFGNTGAQLRDGWPYISNLKILFCRLNCNLRYLCSKQSQRICIKLFLATLGPSHMTNFLNISINNIKYYFCYLQWCRSTSRNTRNRGEAPYFGGPAFRGPKILRI